jgi:addiction module RelE/StbE family toxin
VHKRPLPVSIYPSAERDLTEIFAYIGAESPSAAHKLLEQIFACIDKLSGFPELYPIVRDPFLAAKGYRLIPVETYLIFYVITKSEVQIRRVVHGKRQYREFL